MKLAKVRTGGNADVELRLSKRERARIGLEPGDELTVNKIFEQKCEPARARWDWIRCRAIRNERFVNGHQNVWWNASTRSITDLTMTVLGDTVVSRNYDTRNLLRSPWMTTSARVLENNPSVHAFAGNNEAFDVAAAEAANQVIEFVSRRQFVADKDFGAAGHCQCSGVVGYRPSWDKTAGPPSKGYPRELDDDDSGEGESVGTETNGFTVDDEDDDEAEGTTAEVEELIGVGRPTGDVAIDALTVHDFYTDGAAEIEHSDWVVFHRLVDKPTAKAMLMDAKIEDDPRTAVASEVDVNWSVAGHASDTENMVLVEELYHLSTPDVPGGLYAQRVSGHVVVAYNETEPHGQLPLSLWQWGHESGCVAPSTHIDDALPEQVAVNELVGAINRLTEEFGVMRMVVLKSAKRSVEDGVTTFVVDTPEEMNAIRFIEPPPIPPILGQQLEERTNAVYVMTGVTDQMAGVAQAGASMAARSIAYQSTLYAQKLSGALRALEACKVRLWGQVLALWAANVDEERSLDVLGEDGEFRSMALRGADIAGADIVLEASAGPSRVAETLDAEQKAAQGLMDPAQAAQVQETGLSTTRDDVRQAVAVGEQINRVLAGEPPAPLPNVDPGLAVEVIETAIATKVGEDPRVLALLDVYLQPPAPASPAPPAPGAPGPLAGQIEDAGALSALELGVS